MRPLLAALAALAALAWPATGAANMEVSPVVVQLSSAVPAAIVTIRNGDPTPVRYQATAFSWTEERAGEPRLAPSQDLSVFPPVFQLAPGEERRIRVGTTVAPGPSERSWRLFVEALPVAVEAPVGKASVQIRTRFALPVYLAPAAPRPRATLTLGRDGGKVTIVLRNTGNVHVRPPPFTVTLLGAAGDTVGELAVPGGFVLPGSARVEALPVSPDRCARVRRATAALQVGEEKVAADLALPAGVCVP